MKNNVTDGLNEVLNVNSELVEVDNFPEPKKAISADAQNDYAYARENIHDVIDKGGEALDYLLELAKQSEHPRAFEVVSQLTKTLVDANKDLLQIQKQLKELQKEERDENPQSVTNALFVGSTADLQKMLKGDDGDEDV
jgi:hypothetical protein